MKILQVLFKPLYLVWAIFWFVFFMLLIFPFVIIASFWGRLNGGNFVYKVLLRAWGEFWFFMSGIRVKLRYEQAPLRAKQYVFVVNHVSNLDAAMLVVIMRNTFRPLGKIELKDVPVFGFIYRVCVVVVDRSSPENRQRSIRQLKGIMNKGLSILIFPEGTFNETGRPMKECFDGAFRLAIETQTPIKPIIFPDTWSRMHPRSVFSLNPGPCRAIFLEEVSVEGLTMEDLPSLKQRVRTLMESKLRDYKAGWITE